MAENPPEQSSVVPVVLSEFAALRGEIAGRSSAAHALMNLNVTASAAVAGFVLSESADPRLLMLLPLLSPALGMLYLDHSHNIMNIGNYIDDTLRPILVDATGEDRLMSYEERVDEYERQRFLRFLPLGIPMTLMFSVVPLVALVLVLPHIDELWAWLVWIVGALLLAAYVTLWTLFLFTPYRSGSHSDAGKGS